MSRSKFSANDSRPLWLWNKVFFILLLWAQQIHKFSKNGGWGGGGGGGRTGGMGGGCTFRGKGLVTWGVGGGGGGGGGSPSPQHRIEGISRVRREGDGRNGAADAGDRGGKKECWEEPVGVSGPASSPGQGSPHQSKLFKKLYRLAKSDSSS